MGSSSSSDAKQTTTNTSGANSPIAGDGSPVNLSSGSQFVLNNSKYDASPTIVAQALNTLQGVIDEALATVRSAGAAVRENNDSNLASQGQLLSQVLGAAQAQSASTSSGGQTEQNKTILYVVGAALAVVAAVFLFRRN